MRSPPKASPPPPSNLCLSECQYVPRVRACAVSEPASERGGGRARAEAELYRQAPRARNDRSVPAPPPGCETRPSSQIACRWGGEGFSTCPINCSSSTTAAGRQLDAWGRGQAQQGNTLGRTVSKARRPDQIHEQQTQYESSRQAGQQAEHCRPTVVPDTSTNQSEGGGGAHHSSTTGAATPNPGGATSPPPSATAPGRRRCCCCCALGAAAAAAASAASTTLLYTTTVRGGASTCMY